MLLSSYIRSSRALSSCELIANPRSSRITQPRLILLSNSVRMTMDHNTHHSLPISRHHLLLLIHIYLFLHFGNAAGPSECFWMDGSKSGLSPCVPAGKRTSGEHSACCSLGDRREPPNNDNDICTNDGLCFWTDSNDTRTMLFRNGCTDSSMIDGACGTYCGSGSKLKHVQTPCHSDGSQDPQDEPT